MTCDLPCHDFLNKTFSLQNQLKALNIGKPSKPKTKETPTASQRSKTDKDANDGAEMSQVTIDEGGLFTTNLILIGLIL